MKRVHVVRINHKALVAGGIFLAAVLFAAQLPAALTTARGSGAESSQPAAGYVQKMNLSFSLRLANRDNPVTEKPPLSGLGNGLYFDARAADALIRMVDDCEKEGYTIWIQSAYRSIEKQEALYKEKINQYVYEGHSREQARILAQSLVTLPGCSDHNLGLGVDFNTVTSWFAQTGAYKWLMQHADTYGFVLRYPADKTQVTGVVFEPWHFRYVGPAHAGQMKKHGLCLEEYVQMLENV